MRALLLAFLLTACSHVPPCTQELAQAVNDRENAYPYVSDMKNYGVSDYWATPEEFHKRGGDCEDAALAKMAALAPSCPDRKILLGWTGSGEPHAILRVRVEDGRYVYLNRNPTASYRKIDFIEAP